MGGVYLMEKILPGCTRAGHHRISLWCHSVPLCTRSLGSGVLPGPSRFGKTFLAPCSPKPAQTATKWEHEVSKLELALHRQHAGGCTETQRDDTMPAHSCIPLPQPQN